MSRQIKFKVYVESILPEETGVYEPEFISGFSPTLGIDKVYTKDFKFKSDTCKFTLLQFTGLFDKNGVEIYEGDIVKHKLWKIPVVVYWEYGSFMAKSVTGELGKKSYTDGSLYDMQLPKCEIIGNIHENSEKIKEIKQPLQPTEKTNNE